MLKKLVSRVSLKNLGKKDDKKVSSNKTRNFGVSSCHISPPLFLIFSSHASSRGPRRARLIRKYPRVGFQQEKPRRRARHTKKRTKKKKKVQELDGRIKAEETPTE